jgi:hypothetical protein
MRKTSTPRYPQPRDVAPVKRALEQYIPMEAPLQYCMRFSIKNTPNFRLQSQTNEIVWYVDVYKGHYYHVTINSSTEVCRTIPALVTYMWRRLGVTPKR